MSDTGIGIPAGELHTVLEPFAQVRSGSHIAHEGTGLGLSLSKKLAEIHGGRLELESEEGVGTVGTVRFPPERTLHRSIGAVVGPSQSSDRTVAVA